MFIARVLPVVAMAVALPMQITINQRGFECLYQPLDVDESVTMSVFILSGAELRATMTLEGPVAPASITSGAELQQAMDKFTGSEYGEHTILQEVVDFEHLQTQILAEEEDDDDVQNSEDDDHEIAEGEDVNSEAFKLKVEQRNHRMALARSRAKEAKKRREAAREETHRKVRDEGEPFQKTLKAKAAGWYRACVRGTWYQIVAEMEMRRESELGGMDPQTGHVFTYEKQTMLAEDKLLDADTASDEEGIEEKDFDKTREMLRNLRRLLSEIQTKQQAERHRLVIHAATNEHSHSRMVLSNLLQTILFMVVTGFQVYTIRKWFSGAPVLGR